MNQFFQMLTLSLALSLSSSAKNENKQISPCLERPIRFAHYEFGALYSKGHGGIDDDVQKELEKRTGCSFQVSFAPRARIWRELEHGALDMAGSGIQNEQRDNFAWFAHYVVENNHVVLSSQVPTTVKNFSDFLAIPNLAWGGVRSYSYSPFYDKNIQDFLSLKRFHDVNDPEMLFNMFFKGRFDGFVTSQFLILYYTKKLKLPFPQRIEDWDPAPGSPSGLVISKKTFRPEQAQIWKKHIVDMLKDGTMKKIVARHVGEQFVESSLYKE